MNNGIRRALRVFWPITMRARIDEIERRLEQRRSSARDHASQLGENLRDSLSSPQALLSAAGVGFALSEMAGRKPGNPGSSGAAECHGDAGQQRPANTSSVATVMEALSLAATLLALLPKAEMRGHDDPQTPKQT